MTKNPTKRQTRKRIDGATAEGEQDTQKEKKSGGKSQMGAVSRQKSSMTTEMDMTTDDETQRQKRQSSRQSKKVGVMGMCKEFDEIKAYTAPGATSDIGAKHPEKNRYADITCLDATRVVLRDDVGNYTSADGDYINANWVTAEDLDRKYIACQGPKPETIEDFWRMVYQESVVSVIMMCRLEEGGKIKCADYFPTKSGDYKNYGKMFVNNKKVESEDRFDTYTLEVLPDAPLFQAKMLAGKYAADMRRFIKDIGDMDQPGKS
ncbi:unnamed protein product, partial [Mesorhabditis spiculigera]